MTLVRCHSASKAQDGAGDSLLRLPGRIRQIIYTTKAIESLHSQVRKVINARGHFPSDATATKLIWLVLRNVSAKWKNPPIAWHSAKAQFAVQFEDRFVIQN